MSEQQDKSALPVGTVVRGYRLLDVLRIGSFGVTYMAENAQGERVALKEYLPSRYVVRDGAIVHPEYGSDREAFERGLDRFLADAGMLTRFSHPNIVKVKGYFEANGTAYIVTEYDEGKPLDELLERRGTLTEAQLKRVLLPIADALRQVHARGVWHRDLTPASVFVRRADESPVLLDFEGNSIAGMFIDDIIYAAPYAPPERYDSPAELGAYTDVYALSALCWRAITGEVPPESIYRHRMALRGGDPLPLLSETRPPGYSAALLRAVDWGLRLSEDERPQSVAEWLDAMGEMEERAALHLSPAQAMPSEPDPTPPARSDSPSSAEPEHIDAEVEESAQEGTFRKFVHVRYAHWLAGLAAGTYSGWKIRAVLATLAVLGVGLLVAPLFNGVRDGVRDAVAYVGMLIGCVDKIDLKAGDRFRDCPKCPEMVVIKAGSFRMGSSHEKGRFDDEGPMHGVTIGASFAVGRHEVTFGQWDICASDGGCPRGGDIANDEGWGRGQRPVINVSWHDAQRYVQWLSRKTSKRYRLLSESEWEYVARAGTDTAYSWGDEIGADRANCNGCRSEWDAKRTAPVGSFEANAWGLHDTHGNVYEWVEDCGNDGGYAGSPGDGSAWLDGDCSRRALRGGSWSHYPNYLRSAYRDWEDAGSRHNSYGFRVAWTLTP